MNGTSKTAAIPLFAVTLAVTFLAACGLGTAPASPVGASEAAAMPSGGLTPATNATAGIAASTATVAVFTPTAMATPRADSPEDLEHLAVTLISERSGVPVESLIVTNAVTVTYPVLERIAFRFKMIEKSGDMGYSITLSEYGEELDPDKLRANERAAYFARYGRMRPELAEYLKQAGPDELIPVVIDLIVPPEPDGTTVWLEPGEPYLDADGKIRNLPRERRIARVKAVVDPVVERLNKISDEVNTWGSSTAMISAVLSPAEVEEVNRWEEVATISLERWRLPKPFEPSPTPSPNAIPFRTLVQGDDSDTVRLNIPVMFIAADLSETGYFRDSGFNQTSEITHFEYHALDFEEQVVIAVFLGWAGTSITEVRAVPGGYQVMTEKAEFTGGSLGTTYPYHIIALPRDRVSLEPGTRWEMYAENGDLLFATTYPPRPQD